MSITDKQMSSETFTLAEIEELYCDLNSNSGTLTAIVDGVRYETDWGYGIDGVMYFIDMLKRRHGLMPDQKKEDMSITYELREYFGKSKGMFTDHVLAIADRIDAEHERQLEVLYRDMSDAEYVKLPKDADGA